MLWKRIHCIADYGRCSYVVFYNKMYMSSSLTSCSYHLTPWSGYQLSIHSNITAVYSSVLYTSANTLNWAITIFHMPRNHLNCIKLGTNDHHIASWVNLNPFLEKYRQLDYPGRTNIRIVHEFEFSNNNNKAEGPFMIIPRM